MREKTTKKQLHYDEVTRIQDSIKKQYKVPKKALEKVEEQRKLLKQVLGL